MAQVIARFENEEMVGEPLSEDESALLQNHLFNVLAYGNDLLTALYQQNLDKIVGAAAVAKNQLSMRFGGAMPSDTEFGIQHIRPMHVLRTTATTETVDLDWTRTFTTDSDYWIGFGTNNTSAINVDKRAVVLPLAVTFSQGTDPTVEEIYHQLNGTTYPVQVLRHSWMSANNPRVRYAAVRLGLWVGKATVLTQIYSIVAAQQQFVPLGVTFGSGAYLRIQEGSGSPQT